MTIDDLLEEYYDENRVEDEDSLIRRAYELGLEHGREEQGEKQ